MDRLAVELADPTDAIDAKRQRACLSAHVRC
jgi:hypothetical protein